ncbi:Holliday junction branch migration DNA helicase RuvB [Patescibacteria group bacterium]|nr:Holliday junction branch migration DNA helicase RuvB [Patescibacteria group bacterium]MBU1705378.1 Holliday junction branch migration DNA helicase RuvB [Patescibacteria group bacterium]
MIERDAEQLESPVSKEADHEERDFEIGLRPQSLAEFIGQEPLKANLEIFIQAAKQRGEPMEHVLLYGNPGLGKTTLAHILANEMGAQIRVTSGPALERVGDLAAILSNLGPGDVLFIDEIHRLNKSIEEVLYPAMEDYALDIIVGKGPTARTLRLNLEKFTIIGATTRLSLLSSPLRDRFGVTHHLNFYEEPDIGQIISRSAGILDVQIDQSSTQLLACRSRRTPRIANRLLRRVRDFAQVKADGQINQQVCQDSLIMLDIDHFGLDPVDRLILKIMIEKFSGGPVGLSTLAAASQEEIQTIEEVHEPFLMQLGLIQRTPRGRTVTPAAYTHLGFDPPVQKLS